MATRVHPSLVAKPSQTIARWWNAARRPLVIWALILLVTLTSFYVHVLQEQVLRGERLRQAQRLAPDASRADGVPSARRDSRHAQRTSAAR